MQIKQFMLNSWESGILVGARSRMPTQPPPTTSLSAESLMNFNGTQRRTCYHNSLGELSVSCTTLFPSGPFANFALYPLAVINLSYECDYMLNLMSASNKPPNLRVVLGTCDEDSWRIFDFLNIDYLDLHIKYVHHICRWQQFNEYILSYNEDSKRLEQLSQL